MFVARGSLAAGQRVTLRFPAERTGDAALEIAGSVIRANPARGEERRSPPCRLRRDRIRARSRYLQDLLAGNVLGTQVTPLREEPGAHREPVAPRAGSATRFEDVQPDQVERRGAPRHRYERRVEAIRWQGASEPQALLAKDLSRTGLCVTASSPLPLRSQLGLALYGRSREEPLFVRAEVVRRDGDGGRAALRRTLARPDRRARAPARGLARPSRTSASRAAPVT